MTDAAGLSEDADVNRYEFEQRLRSPASIAAELFPTADLDAQQSIDLAHGKRVQLSLVDAPVVAAITPDGRLAGMISVTDGSAKVLVNFPVDEVLT